MRGATISWRYKTMSKYISIHAPHARSDLPPACAANPHQHISIHAPHARSDLRGEDEDIVTSEISIHAPHARSDMMRRPVMAAFYIFQSTLLMRGATAQMAVSTISSIFQSTLLMRGATQPCHQCHHGYLISIHAPHARSDRHLGDRHNHLCHISIHAPHARSDYS